MRVGVGGGESVSASVEGHAVAWHGRPRNFLFNVGGIM